MANKGWSIRVLWEKLGRAFPILRRNRQGAVLPPTPSPKVVAFVTPTRPRSANANPTTRFTNAIAASAQAAWSGPFLSSPLYARIVWFHKYRRDGDVDNIAKRLLDSLKGVVYSDDQAITHCLTCGVDARYDVELDGSAVEATVFANLEALVANNTDRDVLYVEIGEQTSAVVRFGPVE